MEYKSTLNMPRTAFDMKANLPAKEPEMLRQWEADGLYRTVQESRTGRPQFILHDGPPYANGDIHLGTALNKILKDFVVKYATMAGYDAPYVPGWDCHGLPIERKALQDLGLDHRQIDPVELRRKCAEHAYHWRDVQREQFKRLGVRGDWDNPYMTIQPHFEAKQVEVFAAMALGGHLYRGMRPVYWCPVDETALAEAEIEYHDKTSHSIHVAFRVTDGKGRLPKGSFVVIWTTTPWTLPGNLAIALLPEAEYGLYRTERGDLLLAKQLAEKALAAVGLASQGLVAEFTGQELEHIVTRHPFLERDSVVVLSDHVTVEDGTGCVHIAPGHGHEDFEVGRRYNLEPLVPIDERGVFTQRHGGEFAGLFVEKANPQIVARLEANGALLKAGKIQHSYAHCWRCKQPVLYRATVQWFAHVGGFMGAALDAIGQVKWIPEWGRNRITPMVEGLTDWCISRQRSWGMPIPVMLCIDCDEPYYSEDMFRRVADVFHEEGSDAWWLRPAADFLPAGAACAQCGGSHFRKETNIMDVWFDSGSTHVGVLETRPDLRWPADMYLEGSDQHRGWFKSSLLTSVVARDGRPPYRQVLTHGFVVDDQGRAMHKSLGNVINPLDVCNQYGADVLRLWVASTEYRNDVGLGPNILKNVAEVYRKVRNTMRFLLGNLYDFDPAADAVGKADLEPIDRWAMHRLQETVRRVREAYDAYEYHGVYHELNRFVTVDLSSVYLDVLKDRLYCEAPAGRERRAAQTVLYRMLDALVRLLAPVLTFTTEEVWRHMPRPAGAPATVQVLEMPQVDPDYVDEDLAAEWAQLLQVRETVSKALEQARAAKAIGSPQEAAVHMTVQGEGMAELLRRHAGELPGLFIVSDVRVYTGGLEAPSGTFFAEGPSGLRVTVARAEGEKCQRCWYYRPLGSARAHPHLCARCAGVVVSLEAGV